MMKHPAFIFPLLLLIAGCNMQRSEIWRPAEIVFESGTDYSSEGGDAVILDVVFTNSRSGATLVRPAFWDGGGRFAVRFAPTETGIWSWSTSCPQDKSMDGLHGSLRCVTYSGGLDIYKHGFVVSPSGKKYLTYADGTPFFYLGDTHWGMYTEEFDEPGPHAGSTGAQSHFKYIVDRRVEQGFTVYQSEPIGARFNLADGKVDAEDIPGFKDADRYYQYIADAGLVHANAELFFVSSMSPELGRDTLALGRLARYWNARFGAYPVLWTLAQEVDNDFYFERGDNSWYDYTCNPWVTFAEYLHRYDCYAHPLSGHQENRDYTTVSGLGTAEGNHPSGGGESAFFSDDVAARTGHNWWAVQWSPNIVETSSPEAQMDYWASERPAVNYEGRYCYLWTKNFGSRAQGWISFLSGFCGYGYGAIDIWLYQSTYDIDTKSFDGRDVVTPEDKASAWSEALEFESATQMGYMRKELEKLGWWKLKPVFPGQDGFEPSDSTAYAYAKDSAADRHILYFYDDGIPTGCLTGLDGGKLYRLSWFNPRTGKTEDSQSSAADESGRMSLPSKPDDLDWVLKVFRETR